MHKLISNESVIYNAETLQTSVLTIVCPNLTFENQINQFGSDQNKHFVNINGRLFANYDTETRNLLNVLNYTLSDTEWDTFYNSQIFTSNSPYDKDLECALYYIKDNLTTMFGLTKSDWIFVI